LKRLQGERKREMIVDMKMSVAPNYDAKRRYEIPEGLARQIVAAGYGVEVTKTTSSEKDKK
jgi:hypothetical protein